MKLSQAAAILAFSVTGLALHAQDDRSGVSNPPPDTAPAQYTAPPSTSDLTLPPGYQPTPAVAPRRELTPSSSETYAPYRPLTAPGTGKPYAGTPVADNAPLSGNALTAPNPDAMIVGDTPSRPYDAPAGTRLRVRIHQTLSTATSRAGDPFTATVTEPVFENNHLLVPKGSTLEGRLSEVHAGNHVGATAALHLDPRRLVLPDGTHYDLHAQLVDTSESFATRIDSEGTLYRRSPIKQTAAAFGVGTGTGAVAGAVIGGGVGAGVGALVGAGVATAWWLKQDRQTVLPQDTNLTFTLNDSLPAIPRY